MNSRVTRQLLQSLKLAGVTHLPRVNLAKPTARPKRLATKTPISQKAGAQTVQRPAKGVATPPALADTRKILSGDLASTEAKTDALLQLSQVVAACTRCEDLACTRQQTVFGVGHSNADVMFIGEAPGADEDRQGEPFVGAAGQLMTRIIEACKWKRQDVYICNTLRCRPPGNRNPLPQELANCREFLDAQIKVVAPKYIVCWGAVAAQSLLNETQSIGRLRSRFFEYAGAKLICTYHPSYLLRYEPAKKSVWEDMKMLMAEIAKDSGSPDGS